jgi:hypothetical protein
MIGRQLAASINSTASLNTRTTSTPANRAVGQVF